MLSLTFYYKFLFNKKSNIKFRSIMNISFNTILFTNFKIYSKIYTLLDMYIIIYLNRPLYNAYRELNIEKEIKLYNYSIINEKIKLIFHFREKIKNYNYKGLHYDMKNFMSFTFLKNKIWMQMHIAFVLINYQIFLIYMIFIKILIIVI